MSPATKKELPESLVAISEIQVSPTQQSTSTKKHDNIKFNISERNLQRTIIPWEDVVLKQRDLNTGSTSRASYAKPKKNPKKQTCPEDKENAKQAISLMYKNARKAFQQNRLPVPNPNNMVSFKFSHFPATSTSTVSLSQSTQKFLTGSFGIQDSAISQQE